MKNIDELRSEINQIDTELIRLFTKRFDVVKEIGAYKKEHNLPVKNPKREEEVLEKLISQSEESELSETFITTVWKAIFQESYRIES